MTPPERRYGHPVVWVLVALPVVALFAYKIAQGPPAEAPYTPPPPPVASVGSDCHISDGTPLATSPARAAEAFQAIVKNDTQNLAAMMAAGHIVWLKKAAKARVLDRDGASLRVRVLDAGAFGLERWVPARFCS